MNNKDKIKAILILAVAFLISVILGFGSSSMGGHEKIIYLFLEITFLIIYEVALLVLSIHHYRIQNKKTGKVIFLSSILSILLGYCMFAYIYFQV